MQAAITCFVERGFHGTAVPQIAKAAGVGAGTLYHYFPSKTALVNEVYRAWKSKVAQRVFTAFPHDAGPREQFGTLWRELAGLARDDPAAFAFIELHNHASYLDAESIALDRNLKQFARTMIERAQQRGALKPLDPTALMELVFGAFYGLIRAHLEGRLELTDALIEAAESACWDAVARH